MWRTVFTLCFFLLLLRPLAADEPTPGVDLLRGPAAGTKRFIVTLQRAADQDGCAGQHSVVRLRSFRHALNGFVADLPPAAVDRLKRDSRVLGVEEDRVVAETGDQLIPTGLQRMEVRPFPVAKIDGLDERIDVDVAVSDSGIQADHPDLNVVQSVDFTGQGLVSTNSHGTNCAGIIGALDNDFGVVGVAPGVRLWSVRTILNNNTLYISQSLAGFDYVALHADQIAVLSCSFGTTYGRSNPRTAWDQAINGLVNRGVIVVAAAMNFARDIAGPDGVLGGDPTDDVLPAALPQVMAVSAMDPIEHQFAIFSDFSRSRHNPGFVWSPGAAIDVVAPGVDIATTALGSSYNLHFGGTSAATPHVAGLVALYISTHGRATDAAGVYRIRQAIIDAALPQSQWPCPDPFDRDVNPRGPGSRFFVMGTQRTPIHTFRQSASRR